MNTKKILISTFCLFLFPFTFLGQNASVFAILDKTSAQLKTNKGIQADFVLETIQNGVNSNSFKGSICLSGNKFKISMPQMLIWHDGKNLWTMMQGSDEVNLSTPTPKELQSINPYAFIDLYKNGYKASMNEIRYQNVSCYEVILNAKSTQKNIEQMQLIIDKTNFRLLFIKLNIQNTWYTFKVQNYKFNQNLSASFFQFPRHLYPDVEVIDLR